MLLEGHTVTVSGATSVNGGSGGDAQAGGGRGPGSTSSSQAGGAGNLSTPSTSTYAGGAGGGGGGGYGTLRVNGSRASAAYACPTTLSPAPVCSSDHSACLCVDDSNCSSGKCVSSGQCTGTCTGVGAADTAKCELLTASMSTEGGGGDGGDASTMEASVSDAAASGQ